MRRPVLLLCILALALVLPAAAAPARPAAAWGRLPIAFEENRGQLDSAVRFLARGPGYDLALTPAEAVVAAHAGGPALRLRWVGGRPGPLTGEIEAPGRTHYLRGADPARWRTGIRSYERVRYREVYPGIDLVFHAGRERLEYDCVVAPGAEPRDLRLAVEGARRLQIDAAGDLVLAAAGGELKLRRPVTYQEAAGGRREVRSRWRRLRDGTFGFAVGPFDRTLPLVIDPVLVYSLYLEGPGLGTAAAVAVDAAGNAYLTGAASSGQGVDAYVAKLDPEGRLVWSTFLGGTGSEGGRGIGLDPSGAIYVTGETSSPDFPRAGTALPPPTPAGAPDVFLAKLDPAGSALQWSAVMGGGGMDEVQGLATDPAGRVYVAGATYSPDFPLRAPLQNTRRGVPDAFLMKLTAEGGLVYSTYLGGSGINYAWDVAADPSGHAYVVGDTTSPDFPTVQAAQPAAGGEHEAFAARVSPAGSSLVWSTYLGGSSLDHGFGIAADPAGNAYVTGWTSSPDFPTRRAFQPELHVPPDSSGMDAFLTKLDPDGALVYSTYLGGSGNDEGGAVAVDARGSAFVAGLTGSADFPVRDAPQPQCAGARGPVCDADAFVAQLTPGGAELVWGTFLGGALIGIGDGAFDYAWDIAIDPAGSSYIVGLAWSRDFPTTPPVLRRTHAPPVGFAAKFSAANRPPDCAAAAAVPGALWPPDGTLRPVEVRGVSDPDGDPLTVAVLAVRQDEPPARPGAPDAAGLGTSAVRLRASRAGGGDGRVYHLRFRTEDGRGGSCEGEVVVCVPHDRRPGAVCGDGGPLHDSAGAGP